MKRDTKRQRQIDGEAETEAERDRDMERETDRGRERKRGGEGRAELGDSGAYCSAVPSWRVEEPFLVKWRAAVER